MKHLGVVFMSLCCITSAVAGSYTVTVDDETVTEIRDYYKDDLGTLQIPQLLQKAIDEWLLTQITHVQQQKRGALQQKEHECLQQGKSFLVKQERKRVIGVCQP